MLGKIWWGWQTILFCSFSFQSRRVETCIPQCIQWQPEVSRFWGKIFCAAACIICTCRVMIFRKQKSSLEEIFIKLKSSLEKYWKQESSLEEILIKEESSLEKYWKLDWSQEKIFAKNWRSVHLLELLDGCSSKRESSKVNISLVITVGIVIIVIKAITMMMTMMVAAVMMMMMVVWTMEQERDLAWRVHCIVPSCTCGTMLMLMMVMEVVLMMMMMTRINVDRTK